MWYFSTFNVALQVLTSFMLIWLLEYRLITWKILLDFVNSEAWWRRDVSMNCVIISSGNTWLPDWHQALTWTNVSTIGPLFIEQTSFEKIHLKVLSVKWRLFRSGLIVLHISMQCWKNIKCKWIFFYQNITQKVFWIFVYICVYIYVCSQ